jgi:hypothetical protein
MSKIIGKQLKLAVGSGGINYISNTDIETNANGYNTYNDGASAVPVDGTGGVSGLSVAQSSVTPLRGSFSLLVSKDATNRQGEGVSYDFTVESTDKARVLTVDLDFESGGGFAPADVTFYVYDITNNVLMQLAPYQLAAFKGRFTGTFQTSSNSTSYRLIAHVTSTSASAWTMKLDRVSVGPAVVAQGTPVTDWQSFTPTWATASTQPAIGNGTLVGRWRRDGDSMEVQIGVNAGSTTTFGAGNWTFSLPPGYTIDTTKLAQQTGFQVLGECYGFIPGNNNFAGEAIANAANNVALISNLNGNNWSSAAPATWTTSSTITLAFKAPVTGWSSNVSMSADTDTRVVAARYSSATSASIATTATVLVNYDVKEYDTHGAVTTGASWKYTVPVAGKYRITAQIALNAMTAGNFFGTYFFKNGIAVLQFEDFCSVTGRCTKQNTSTIDCIAGDTIDFRVNQQNGAARVMSSEVVSNWITIERLSGPAQIAATESVNARASGTVGAAPGANNPIVVPTKDFDTHGSYSTTTGKFTVPVSGKYRVSGYINATGVSNWPIVIFKNNTADISIGYADAASQASGSGIINCVAGDQLYLGSTSVNMSNIGAGCFVSFERIGN